MTAPVVRDIVLMQRTADAMRAGGKRIGVVPTMGALHEGHCSLIRIARQHADAVVTTIFVNPMQFGPSEDYDRYPRDLDRDAQLATDAGATTIFAPDAASMYLPDASTSVVVEGLTAVLEGRSRPGHFRGVTTAVTKLFLITKPHCAVFGQKDAQQIAVVRRMMRDLNFDLRLIVAPIVREADGLALSSRNAYLTPGQRREAPVLYRSLQEAERMVRAGERDAGTIVRHVTSMITAGSSGLVDYVSLADADTLLDVAAIPSGGTTLLSLAVRFGTTRLIDNVILTLPDTA